MGSKYFSSPEHAIEYAISMLVGSGVKVDPGRWQGVPTEGKPDLVTKELLDLDLAMQMPETREKASRSFWPSVPWAENHFLERVSRVPSNPGEEYKNWPWWRGQDEVSMEKIIGTHSTQRNERNEPLQPFTHTYQERFWPKKAGDDPNFERYAVRLGIRYEYGDLDDVVNLLRRDPQSRQAYLPIFFPEDTGAVHGGRVPCTLGYHFLLRNGLLHCWYDIRSCDAVRHFRDDLYLACRLVQWVLSQLRGTYEEMRAATDPPPWGRGEDFEDDPFWEKVNPGTLFFKAHSFHVHMGDYHLLQP